MIPPGFRKRFRLSVGGRTIVNEGDVWVTEDLRRGFRFEMSVSVDTEIRFGPGDALNLEVDDPDDDGPDGRLRFSCICQSVDLDFDGRTRRLLLAGADPLEFCDSDPEFRSHPGNTTLAQVIRRVLDAHTSGFGPAPSIEGSGPRLESEWLLQNQETGAEFIRRWTTRCAHLLYWDRLRYKLVDLADHCKGLTVDLGARQSLVHAHQRFSMNPPSITRWWTDPVRRLAEPISENGGMDSGRDGQRVLHDRTAHITRPEACESWRDVQRDGGRVVDIETVDSGLTLGCAVRLPEHWGVDQSDDLRVETIVHHLSAIGTYTNHAKLVPAARWGRGGYVSAPSVQGLLTAEVTHNVDPQRLGRVRVLLHEDAERRPTPWIPLAIPVAGESMGLHWVPEVGQTVLLIADPGAPELLHCIGCVRGDAGRTASEWGRQDNSLKVLATRNGLRIAIDDSENGSILLESPRARFEIRSDGTIRARGQSLEVEMGASARIEAEQSLLFDANRIDLGR